LEFTVVTAKKYVVPFVRLAVRWKYGVPLLVSAAGPVTEILVLLEAVTGLEVP